MANAIAIYEDAPKGKKYTRKEAEQATAEFIASGCQFRQLLLDLYERQAHTALGYAEFEAYTRDRLGTEWKTDYLRQLRFWARIEREALVITNANAPARSLTQAEMKQLARLPAGERRPLYEEVCVLHSMDAGAAQSPKFITDLTHAVNRKLLALNGVSGETTREEQKAERERKKAEKEAVRKAAEAQQAQEAAAAAKAASETATDAVASIVEDNPAEHGTWEDAEEAEAAPDEDVEYQGPDWDDIEVSARTYLTWVENRHIDGTNEDRQWVAAHLQFGIGWIRGK